MEDEAAYQQQYRSNTRDDSHQQQQQQRPLYTSPNRGVGRVQPMPQPHNSSSSSGNYHGEIIESRYDGFGPEHDPMLLPVPSSALLDEHLLAPLRR